jgi:hypothetical protein
VSRTLILGAGILSTAMALTLPLVAQESGGMKEKEKMHHEEVTIDRPFVEVASKVPNAIEHSGLILLGDIDWTRFKGKGTMPGGHKLDPAVTNIRSFLLCDEVYVNKVIEEPNHALWAPAIAVCEKGGKTSLLYYKPTVKLEELRKHGMMSPEKYEEHFERAKQFEKKLDEVIETLRGTRSS